MDGCRVYENGTQEQKESPHEKTLRIALKKIEKKFRKAWSRGKTLEIWTKEIGIEDDSDLLDGSLGHNGEGPGPLEVMTVPDQDVFIGKVKDENAMVHKGWKKLKGGITMVSAAAVDIMPEDENPEFPITELTGPRRGRRLVAANDTPITSKGEKCFQLDLRQSSHQSSSSKCSSGPK